MLVYDALQDRRNIYNVVNSHLTSLGFLPFSEKDEMLFVLHDLRITAPPNTILDGRELLETCLGYSPSQTIRIQGRASPLMDGGDELPDCSFGVSFDTAARPKHPGTFSSVWVYAGRSWFNLVDSRHWQSELQLSRASHVCSAIEVVLNADNNPQPAQIFDQVSFTADEWLGYGVSMLAHRNRVTTDFVYRHTAFALRQNTLTPQE